MGFRYMGNKHNLLAAVSLLALGGTAHADDMTAPEVPDWTGFYVGAGGGGNYLFSALVFDDTNITRESWTDDAGVARGFGTIELGADYQFDSNFLIGAVGNFDFGGSMDLGSYETSDTPWADAEWQAGNSWGIGARAGFLASPRTLIYGVGGFTQLDVSTDLFAGTDNATRDDEWTSGYFVGAGVETLLTDNLSLKLEYRFSRYDEVSATSSPIIGPGPMPEPMPHPDNGVPCWPDEVCNAFSDIDSHTVRLTLAWRFGR